MYIQYHMTLSPLREGCGPIFKKILNWDTFSQGCFAQSLAENWNWPRGSGEEDENVKSLLLSA